MSFHQVDRISLRPQKQYRFQNLVNLLYNQQSLYNLLMEMLVVDKKP